MHFLFRSAKEHGDKASHTSPAWYPPPAPQSQGVPADGTCHRQDRASGTAALQNPPVHRHPPPLGPAASRGVWAPPAPSGEALRVSTPTRGMRATLPRTPAAPARTPLRQAPAPGPPAGAAPGRTDPVHLPRSRRSRCWALVLPSPGPALPCSPRRVALETAPWTGQLRAGRDSAERTPCVREGGGGGLCRCRSPRESQREMAAPGSAEPELGQELAGEPVPVRAGAFCLPEHGGRSTTLSEELSSLDVLCDTEFKEEFVKLFKSSLCTLPSVGLPALLAFRPESSQEHMEIQPKEDSAPRCEYCGSLLQPFPSFKDICPQDYESKFCCERNRDLYEFIVNERKKHESAWSHPSTVSPHQPHGTKESKLQPKEKTSQRYYGMTTEERQVAKELEAFLAEESASVAERPNQPGTISYQLSREPPSEEGWTLVPGSPAAAPEEETLSNTITCCDFTPVGAKAVRNQLLEKYYKHGGKFLTMLPDGTVQLFYPSGNLAIIVVREKSHLVCIVQEDKKSMAAIQAVFTSSGRSTCYYPGGSVWITMNIQGGQYMDQAGSRVRRWMWPNTITSPGPHLSLSPIFISLNLHVGVRILGQDKITVSFLAMGQQAKFNVGTKVQPLNTIRLPPPAPASLSEEELLLLALRVRILWLLHKLHGCLSFPSYEQRDKIKPPAYLITQTLKLLKLCTTSGRSDELRSWIRAIADAQI
ncbi:glutamate-rich protein 6 [Phaethornis superciliosus]